MTSTADLNALSDADFVSALAGIYEDSPWVPRAVLDQRPFADRASLQTALRAAVDGAEHEAHLALLRAHPELARRARMSADSVREQAGAGLDQLTPDEHAHFLALNDAYRERHGFPFIVAVRGLDKNNIRTALETRLHHTPEEEFRTALTQVHRIAALRLHDLIQED